MKYLYPVLITLFATSTLQAGTMLTFDVTTAIERPNGDNIVKKESKYELKVYLGDSFIEEQSQGDICIRDFRDMKIYRSNEGVNGFAAYSLFSDIGFRVYEFQNRMRLGSVLGASGIEDNPMDHVLMEHLFSLRSDRESDLKREKKGNHVVFAHNMKELFRYSIESIPVPDTAKERFLLFLRYRYGIHPQILSDLEKLTEIPRDIVVYRYNVGSDQISLKLIAADNTKDQPRRELTPLAISGEGLVHELSKKVKGCSTEDYSKACKRLKKKAVVNAKAGKHLDAASLFIGYTLATGKQMPPEFFEFKNRITNDTDVQLLFSSISPESKETAERAVMDLKKLSDKSKDGVSTILIFRANILSSLGKQADAIDSFLSALSKEPMIVGAWKDLGDIYYSNYDAETAWLCWDAGRSLNQTHKLFDDINQLEKKLQDDHPEFFLK